jgi:hypothetical protein
VDGLRRAQLGWDALVAAPPDEAADEALPAPLDARYAEKLAARERGVRVQGARSHWPPMLLPLELALCTRDGGRFEA